MLNKTDTISTGYAYSLTKLQRYDLDMWTKGDITSDAITNSEISNSEVSDTQSEISLVASMNRLMQESLHPDSKSRKILMRLVYILVCLRQEAPHVFELLDQTAVREFI